MIRELYINGRLLDLSDDEPIAITYQVNDIAELTDRQASYSNRFSVPNTNRNAFILNFSNKPETNTLYPYRRLPAYYIQNGIPTIKNGIAIIDGFDGKYEITLYAGIYDFFSQLGDLSLKDIDWSDINHVYDLASIRTLNENYLKGTSNVCWPLINWGAYKANQNVDIKYQQPALRFSEIINRIFEKTTFSKSGNIFSEGIYLDEALTLSPDEQTVDQSYLDDRTFIGSVAQPWNDFGVPQQGGPSISNVIAFLRHNLPGGFTDNLYIDGVNELIIPWPQAYLPQHVLNTSSYKSDAYLTVEIHIKLLFDRISLLGNENIRIFKNDVLYHIVQVGDYPDHAGAITNLQFEDTYTIDLKPGDVIKVQLYAINFSLNIDTTKTFMSITAINTIPLGGDLNYNFLVPDLKLKDIIKSFCQQFGLIITPSDDIQTMVFTEFREIRESISKAENWSNKLDLSTKPTITYRIGNYAQINNFKYATDDTTKGFGDSSFEINDTILEPSTDCVQLIYPSALPETNIRTTSYKFLTLPLPDYFSKPQWKNFTAYSIGDQVGNNAIIYVCIANISGLISIDIANASFWQIRTDQYLTNQPNQGVKIDRYTLIKADGWDSEKSYSQGDEVNYAGIIYVAINDTTGNIPSISLGHWIVRGVQFEQTISSLSRLVLIRPITPGIKSADNIAYTDGVSTVGSNTDDYPMAYFSDGTQAYNLTFQYLISTYYPELKNMLNQLKSVECLIRLNDVDINKLDFLKLKYIEYFGNYFYLNKVNEYISGQSVSCQLIRM